MFDFAHWVDVKCPHCGNINNITDLPFPTTFDATAACMGCGGEIPRPVRLNFEAITRPTAASKDDTLLLRENTPNDQKQVRVRLFYSDGTVSDVVNVDAEILSEKSKQFCSQLREPELFMIPTHRFLKVNDLDEILIMMGLTGEDRHVTPKQAVELLGNVITIEQIENLIAEDRLQTSRGKVWLNDVKKLIDEGHTGGIPLVQ